MNTAETPMSAQKTYEQTRNTIAAAREKQFADARREIVRLRDALFRIQCDQLERATNTDMTARQHRKWAMATRDRIMTILAERGVE